MNSPATMPCAPGVEAVQMRFNVQPMSEQDAQAIAKWQYDGEYAFYDMDQDPDDLAELLNPQSWVNSYFSVVDNQYTLVGFFCFTESEGALEIGLGLRPDLTGKGLGVGFIETGLAFARASFGATTFRLAVATFNQRAIRLYEKAGFKSVRIYQTRTNGRLVEFLEMVLSGRVES